MTKPIRFMDIHWESRPDCVKCGQRVVGGDLIELREKGVIHTSCAAVMLIDADVQCARCGSSIGWEPSEDEGKVFYFCLSTPEWCESHPRDGREDVRRGTPEYFEVYSDGSVVIVDQGGKDDPLAHVDPDLRAYIEGGGVS